MGPKKAHFMQWQALYRDFDSAFYATIRSQNIFT